MKRLAAVVLGILIGLVLMQLAGFSAESQDVLCDGEYQVFSEPLYDASSTGFTTAEEAARAVLPTYLPGDIADEIDPAEWESMPLASGGVGSTTFTGTFEKIAPESGRGEFDLTVSKTQAGGYLFSGGRVCLDSKPTT